MARECAILAPQITDRLFSVNFMSQILIMYLLGVLLHKTNRIDTNNREINSGNNPETFNGAVISFYTIKAIRTPTTIHRKSASGSVLYNGKLCFCRYLGTAKSNVSWEVTAAKAISSGDCDVTNNLPRHYSNPLYIYVRVLLGIKLEKFGVLYGLTIRLYSGHVRLFVSLNNVLLSSLY